MPTTDVQRRLVLKLVHNGRVRLFYKITIARGTPGWVAHTETRDNGEYTGVESRGKWLRQWEVT